LAFGGNNPVRVCTESYNGSTWTAGGSMGTARYLLAGAGTNTSAVAFGGSPGSSPYITAVTELYNGSTWTAGGALGTARSQLAGAGASNTVALGFGGYGANYLACTESFKYSCNRSNLSTWTSGPLMNTTRTNLSGTGTNDSALAIGGATPTISSSTELYNGVWTTSPSLNISRCGLAAAGTSINTVAFGGCTTVAVTCTEEYNGTAWYTANNLNTARFNLAGAGTQCMALAFGGSTPTLSNATESYSYNNSIPAPFGGGYNGVWTTSSNLPTSTSNLSGAGIQTSAIAFGGVNPTVTGVTNEYNGNTWTAGATMATARCSLAGAGTKISAVAIGGFTTVGVLCTELYNKSCTVNYDAQKLFGTMPATIINNNSISNVTNFANLTTNPTSVILIDKGNLSLPSTNGYVNVPSTVETIKIICNNTIGDLCLF
jgi:hypothetical protein